MLKNKTILILVLIALLIVFDYLVPSIDVSKRAIVVGIGLGQQDGRLLLSVQSLSRKKSETAEYQVDSVLCDELVDGIETLGLTLGGRLSLAHTLTIIVEDNAVAISALDYLSKNNLVSDRTYILATTIAAKDVLSAKATGNESTSALLRESQEIAKTRAGVLPCNVRKYLSDSSGTGRCVNLPVVTLKEESFSITTSLSVKDGSPVFLMDEEGCLGVSLVEGRIFDAKTYVKDLDASVELVSSKLSFSMTGGVVKLQLKLSAKAFNSQGLGRDEQLAVEKHVISAVIHAFNQGATHDCDVLHVFQRVKAFYPNEWSSIPPEISLLPLQVEVKFV
ncbi:MAG: hypothetical protein ACI4MY_07340 [Christensenellales bacterium]